MGNQNLFNTGAEGPRAHAVSSAETEHARGLLWDKGVFVPLLPSLLNVVTQICTS